MKRLSYDAVIFDLDGVITKTALVHGAAWKAVFDEYMKYREQRDGEPFREFTHENDYLPYVDGKPRYEGVKSFLESRGIHIPYGEPEDDINKETVCGIGNRKNSKFLDILKDKGVEVYPSTIKFIENLRDKGVHVGVASSSKNCKFVLKSADIEFLFETRVDGEVSAKIGLKGKPEGDIFVTASLNVGVLPEKAVVVEDATSGVQAGRNGAFGLVIGIARERNTEELLEYGADVVVPDMEYIDIEWMDKWFRKKPVLLSDSGEDKGAEEFLSELEGKNITINPCYYKNGDEALSGGREPVFFLDYDGTLSPIVERPELAVISDEMKDAVKRLADKYKVAIVSGRSRKDVEKLVGIKDIVYAGNHGFNIKGPGISMMHPEGEKAIGMISELAAKFSEKLKDIPGILIENKEFSVAVHFRLVEDKFLDRIEETVEEQMQGNDKLRLMKGKKILEIMPAVNWDKGRAVRWLVDILGVSWKENTVFYFGDDVTDEDAFRILRTRGTGILVSKEPRVSAADFRVASTEDAKELFLKALG